MAIKVNNITVIGDDLNVSNVGVVTATSFSGSAAGLTNVSVPVAGEVEAVASGSISDGNKVVINSNGTVSAVNANLTATNFVGISKSSYTDGQTATIQITGSVDDAQTGLTAGSKYYVQTNGTLSTTPDTPSVFAGTAIASNKIIVKQ